MFLCLRKNKISYSFIGLWRLELTLRISLFSFELKLVVLYVDFKLDESYTPSKISICAGDGFHNLKVPY